MPEISRRALFALASLALRAPGRATAVAPAALPPPTAVLDFAIAGALHHALGRPGVAEALVARPGLVLALRREPENPFDRFAVAVLAPDGGARLGYVPRESSEAVATVLDEGVRLRAEVLRALGARDGWGDGLVLTDFRPGEPRLRLWWLG